MQSTFYRDCPAKTNGGWNWYQSKGLPFALNHWYFLFKFYWTCSLNSKNQFQRQKPKYVAYPIWWGVHCKSLIAVSQPANSGNRLSSIVSTVGISLPLQFKQISSGTQFPLSVNSRKPIVATNHKTGFQWEMQENYYLWILIGFPLSVLCSWHPIELDKPHILA